MYTMSLYYRSSDIVQVLHLDELIYLMNMTFSNL